MFYQRNWWKKKIWFEISCSGAFKTDNFSL